MRPRKVVRLKQQLLDIFKRSGDTGVGQTLVRLAKLASAVHRYETASQLHTESHADTGCRIDGFDSSFVVHPASREAGGIHTEVDR